MGTAFSHRYHPSLGECSPFALVDAWSSEVDSVLWSVGNVKTRSVDGDKTTPPNHAPGVSDPARGAATRENNSGSSDFTGG